MDSMMQFVKEIILEAGEIVCQGYHSRVEVGRKGRIDLVTNIDRQSENYLIERIEAEYPDHIIFAEESGETFGDADHRWYIDPIDGTVNFAHGIPIFSVSIAYAYKDEIRLGAVYDPTRDELFTAIKGEGAWLNGEPIRPTSVEKLVDALLVTGFPYDIAESKVDNLENYAAFAKRTQGVRRLGSAALDMCYVACGRLDGYWEIKLSAYDIAAGILIATEAGVKVTDIDGTKDLLAHPLSIIAANPVLHQRMFEVLLEVDSNK